MKKDFEKDLVFQEMVVIISKIFFLENKAKI
jgi:hypothetical protein